MEQSHFFSSASRAIWFFFQEHQKSTIFWQCWQSSFLFFFKQCLQNVFQRCQQSIFQELVEQSCFFSDACRFFSVAKVKQYDFFTSLIFFSAGPAQLFQRCQQSIFQQCQLEQSDYFSGTCWFLHQFDSFFQQCQHSCFRGASREFFSSATGAAWFFQWHLLIFFSGASGAVHFAFSLAPMEHVSVVPAEHFSAVEWSSPILNTRNNDLRWYWWGTLVYFWMSRVDWNNSMKCHCNWAIWASPIISLLTSLTTFVFMI